MAIELAALQDDWESVGPLLDEALSRPPQERAAWLAGLAGPSARFRDTLAALLAETAAIETDDFLAALPRFGAAGESGPLGIDALAAGAEVGPYRLIEEIGRGGMGAVWLAERSDAQPRRRVALKLPHVGWEPGLAARLARERDILASLEHPHIARLYDAGLDAHGRPYLAMEYVDGTPIDRFVREHGVSIDGRLRLLRQVCAAVAHAHARLVVHRDLKPANILVGADGQVRLLDFGIARLLEPDAPGASDLTRDTGRALTPDYASPEQIRGEAIGTASDVYSLGVVAYEVLTGNRPYRLQAHGSAGLAAELAAVSIAAPSRAVVEPALRRRLAGDIDAVVARALRADAAERYASIEALAADLDRVLRDEPVSAQPDRWSYRARKFAVRHRWQVLSASVALSAVLAGAVVALWQAHEARLETARAEQVKRFALSMLESADTDAGAGTATTAVDLLLAARARVESELAGRPGMASELMTAIGFGLLGHGRAQDAAALLQKAVALSTQAHGADDRRTLAAQVVYGEALVGLDRTSEAIALLQPAALRARRLGEAHAEVEAWRWLSSAQINAGDADASIDSARRAVAALAPADDSRRARMDGLSAHFALANALANARRPGAAEPAAQALAFAEKIYGERRSALAAGARVLLGQGLIRDGRVVQGLQELDRGYAETRALLGDRHPQTATTANLVGTSHLEAGDAAGAVDAYRLSFDAVTKGADAPGPFSLGMVHYSLAAALAASGDREAALPLYAEAARRFAESGSGGAGLALRARSAQALTLARMNRLDESEAAFAALQDAPFAGPDKAAHEGRLARLRSLQSRHDDAVRLARSSVDGLRTLPSPAIRAQSLATLGSVLFAAGRRDEAAASLEQAIALFGQAHAVGSPEVADAKALLARAREPATAPVAAR